MALQPELTGLLPDLDAAGRNGFRGHLLCGIFDSVSSDVFFTVVRDSFEISFLPRRVILACSMWFSGAGSVLACVSLPITVVVRVEHSVGSVCVSQGRNCGLFSEVFRGGCGQVKGRSQRGVGGGAASPLPSCGSVDRCKLPQWTRVLGETDLGTFSTM